MTYDIISTRRYRKQISIKQPNDIFNFLKKHIIKKREQFIVLTLNGSHNVISSHIITIGLVNRTIIHPREVFQCAILDNSSSIVLVHNHPSGNIKPSEEDNEITVRMKEAGELLGISVLDHLIISKDSYFSYRQETDILK